MTCKNIEMAKVGDDGVTEGGLRCPDTVYMNDTVLVCPTPAPVPTPAPAPTPPPTPLPPGCVKHVVVAGDTCQRAAGAMKTTVPQVSKLLNGSAYGCSQSQLFPGDVLVGCATPGYPPANCTWHTVVVGDSCHAVAQAAKVNDSKVTEGGMPCPGDIEVNDTLLVCH